MLDLVNADVAALREQCSMVFERTLRELWPVTLISAPLPARGGQRPAHAPRQGCRSPRFTTRLAEVVTVRA